MPPSYVLRLQIAHQHSCELAHSFWPPHRSAGLHRSTENQTLIDLCLLVPVPDLGSCKDFNWWPQPTSCRLKKWAIVSEGKIVVWGIKMTLLGGSQSYQSSMRVLFTLFLKKGIIYFHSHVKVRTARLLSELLPVSALPPPLRFYLFIFFNGSCFKIWVWNLLLSFGAHREGEQLFRNLIIKELIHHSHWLTTLFFSTQGLKCQDRVQFEITCFHDCVGGPWSLPDVEGQIVGHSLGHTMRFHKVNPTFLCWYAAMFPMAPFTISVSALQLEGSQPQLRSLW